MDETFTGPDNTSSVMPCVFWANNDYDRWHTNLLDGVVEDDLETAPQPDCNYTDFNGNRAIPCPRDLEDYARLWVSGVSNILSRLPMWSTVNLSWQNNSGVTIDVFQAADPDGGMGYLTNITTASNQLDPNLYVGRLGPGQSLALFQTDCADTDCDTFTNIWLGEHYIFCGVTSGEDQLNLTITDDNGNTLAQSSQWIQIQDIKQMYERWTVGDNPNTPPAAPMSSAMLAQDNFSPGYPTTPFAYSYNPATDTNDNRGRRG